jgi:hypothetical protein
MKRTITLSTFRRVNAAEEQMIRAMMPATSEASPEPVPFRAYDRPVTKTLTYRLAEVAR